MDASKYWVVVLINLYSCSWCSGHFLELNYRLIKSINPDLDFRWIICNQSPPVYRDIIIHPEYIIYERENELKGEYIYGMASVSHGNGLNFLFQKAKDLEADYHLVIDPDFYCFRPIQEIANTMRDRDINMMGVGYPNRFRMFKYIFTCASCAMFTMYRNLNMMDLDFSADLHLTPPVGDILDPTGLRRDVGYKIMLRALDGQFSQYNINNNMMTNNGDVYYEGNHLFGIHVHSFREHNADRMGQSDNSLTTLPNAYHIMKTAHDMMLDFSFIDDELKSFIYNANNCCKKMKERGIIPSSVS